MLKLTFKDLDLRHADFSVADLRDADLRGANLSHADLSVADLRDADLRGANLSHADLRCANLRDANLSGADLSVADLRCANLSGADLSVADLRCADLRGAKIKNDTILRLLAYAGRMDGYAFYAFELEDSPPKIMAGCRWFTFFEFRAHIESNYPGTEKAIETGHILDFLQARAIAQGVTL